MAENPPPQNPTSTDITIGNLIQGSSSVVTVDEAGYKIVLRGPRKWMKVAISETLASHVMMCRKPSFSIYGLPTTAFQSDRSFKPQMELYFNENKKTADASGKKRSKAEGEIKIRVMNKESDTITKADIQTFINNITLLFASGGGFTWKKGKVMCAYSDWDKGYQLQLLCLSEGIGRGLVQRILSIQGHSPEWHRFTVNKNAEPEIAYPSVPLTKSILNNPVPQPIKRRVVDVRFRYAVLHVYGLPNPITLVGRPGKEATLLS